jgi:two-component system, chemotaxis family, chemotaxis protein CheY
MAKSVLVVDDSGSFRTVVNLTLKQAGYEVTEAKDGQEAVEKIQAGKFNLVICDLNMPNLDGLAFTRKIKAMPAYKVTPVLMLSTETQDAKKAEGKAAGVSAWLSKPFQPSRLLYAVQAICPT